MDMFRKQCFVKKADFQAKATQMVGTPPSRKDWTTLQQVRHQAGACMFALLVNVRRLLLCGFSELMLSATNISQPYVHLGKSKCLGRAVLHPIM